MKMLILNHFNVKIGPVSILYHPTTISHRVLEKTAQLLNIMENKDFFIHIIRGMNSANHQFNISNEEARGGFESLQISMILTDNNINVDFSQKFLAEFVAEIKKIPEVHKAFYKEMYKDGEDKFVELESLFKSFYDAIPEEKCIQNQRDAKVFIFGLAQAGKTSIIKRMQFYKEIETVPTTNVSISRVFLNNLSLMVYDAPGQMKFRNLWNSYLQSQDAFVFVFDVCDKIHYDEASTLLREIVSLDIMRDNPLLILLNKVDLADPDMQDITTKLDLGATQNLNYRMFQTSALLDTGIKEAFKWLIQELAKRMNLKVCKQQPAEIKEGIILAQWNEKAGLELLNVHPSGAFSDPEIIAIRCFSMAEYIYGGEKFSKPLSFILPIAHLKVNAAIYFNFLDTKMVRGEKLPLCLIIIYKDDVPMAKIEQLHPFVSEKLNEIKEIYQQDNRFNKKIDDIYDRVIDIKKSADDSLRDFLNTYF